MLSFGGRSHHQLPLPAPHHISTIIIITISHLRTTRGVVHSYSRPPSLAFWLITLTRCISHYMRLAEHGPVRPRDTLMSAFRTSSPLGYM